MLGDDFVEPGLQLESPSVATEMMEWFRWRLNRLRCMTPMEVSHRLLRTLSMRAERAGLMGSGVVPPPDLALEPISPDRKSTRLNSSHITISYAVFCLKKKKHDVESSDSLMPL